MSKASVILRTADLGLKVSDHLAHVLVQSRTCLQLKQVFQLI